MSNTYLWRGQVECSICGHERQAVVEIDKEYKEPIIPIECIECGNMTCSAKEN